MGLRKETDCLWSQMGLLAWWHGPVQGPAHIYPTCCLSLTGVPWNTALQSVDRLAWGRGFHGQVSVRNTGLHPVK